MLGVVTTVEPMQIVLEYVTYGDLRAVLKSCRTKGVAVNVAEQLYIAKQVIHKNINFNFTFCCFLMMFFHIKINDAFPFFFF